MSAYKPFLFEDADEEEAPLDLPKSKDTPAKVTKVAKIEPEDSENFSGFSGFSGSNLAFAEISGKHAAPLPNRTDPPEPGSTQPLNQQVLDAVKAGAGCWVWSSILEAWLFWVRDEERKAKAIRRGIDAGCIWTLEELTGVQGMPPEGLRDVAKLKRQFGGTVQPGDVPARWRDALQPLEPVVAGEVAA